MKKLYYSTTILFFTVVLSYPFSSNAQTWKRTLEKTGTSYRDYSITKAGDGSNNIVLAGTLLDTTTQKHSVHVIRMDIFTSNIIFEKTFEPDDNARGLSIASFKTSGGDSGYAISGFTEVNGFRKALVLLMDETGNLSNEAYYDLEPSGEHSQAVHIQATPGDPDEGFVLVGIVQEDEAFSSFYNTDKQGFCLKVRQDLTIQWAKYIDSQYPYISQDFDVASHVTVTDQGYFITGGKNIAPIFHQQGVLAIMLDTNGNLIWDTSYAAGNAFDVGASVYYDQANQKIFLLVNYSAAHHFGITAFDAITGNVDNSMSMTTQSMNLDKYGFCVQKSPNPSSLQILGFAKDEGWFSPMPPVQKGAPAFIMEYNYVDNTLGLHYMETNLSLSIPEQIGIFEPFYLNQFPAFFYPQGLLYIDDHRGSVYLSYEANSTEDLPRLKVHKLEHPNFEFCDSDSITLELGNCCGFFFSDSLNLSDIIVAPQSPSFNAFDDPSTIKGECFVANQKNPSIVAPSWTIAPNPSNGSTIIDLESFVGIPVQLKIYDALGRLTFSKELDQVSEKVNLNLHHLPQGFYLVSIKDELGRLSQRSLILKD